MEQNQNNNSNNNENNNENNNSNNNENNNNNNDPKIQLKKEILDFGFDSEKIDLAMKISSDKEEIINLIVQMIEQPEFYLQLKSQQNPIQNQNQLQNQNLNNIFQNIFHNNQSQYKMVIIVRTDLKMSIGKTSAQVAHAVLGAYKLSLQNNITKVNNWENFSGQAKIVLGVDNREQLFDIKKKADENGLITCLIHDAGRTQVAPNTPTCCAIGPDTVENIDKITGNLKLL